MSQSELKSDKNRQIVQFLGNTYYYKKYNNTKNIDNLYFVDFILGVLGIYNINNIEYLFYIKKHKFLGIYNNIKIYQVIEIKYLQLNISENNNNDNTIENNIEENIDDIKEIINQNISKETADSYKKFFESYYFFYTKDNDRIINVSNYNNNKDIKNEPINMKNPYKDIFDLKLNKNLLESKSYLWNLIPIQNLFKNTENYKGIVFLYTGYCSLNYLNYKPNINTNVDENLNIDNNTPINYNINLLSFISTKKIGSRYFCRGVNKTGDVSFFVKTIYSVCIKNISNLNNRENKYKEDFNYKITLYRGSVPFYWGHDNESIINRYNQNNSEKNVLEDNTDLIEMNNIKKSIDIESNKVNIKNNTLNNTEGKIKDNIEYNTSINTEDKIKNIESNTEDKDNIKNNTIINTEDMKNNNNLSSDSNISRYTKNVKNILNVFNKDNFDNIRDKLNVNKNVIIEKDPKYSQNEFLMHFIKIIENTSTQINLKNNILESIDKNKLNIDNFKDKIIVIDLLGSKKDERLLSNYFKEYCIKYGINYYNFDLNKYQYNFDSMNERLTLLFEEIIKDLLIKKGNNKNNEKFYNIYDLLNEYIIRVNCLDCLDRTNVAELLITKYIINNINNIYYISNKDNDGIELIIEENNDNDKSYSNKILDLLVKASDSNCISITKDIFNSNGNALSHFYSNTSAHKNELTRVGKRSVKGILGDLVITTKRVMYGWMSDYEKNNVIKGIVNGGIVNNDIDITNLSEINEE